MIKNTKKKAKSGRVAGPWMRGYNSVLIVDLPPFLEFTDEILLKYHPDPTFKETPDFYEGLDDCTIKEELVKQLETITERERGILYCRYFDEMTLEETGSIFNVSRERVRQLEAKALRKMRHPTRAKNLLPIWLNLSPEEVEEKQADDNLTFQIRKKMISQML